MWILSCDGELLQGKKLWLRPGSTHLLGRTSNRAGYSERVQYIEHRTVSRKHLLIAVGAASAADCGQLHVRPSLTVTDASKSGTTVNDDKFKGETRTLGSQARYTIRLGSYEALFHIEWRPIVLTFTNLGKSSKSNGDGLRSYREKLDGTDVKLVTEYITNETTHLVAKKRNSPAVLQALVHAKWVVTDAFVDALGTATAPRGVDGDGDAVVSLLEEDFDGNWPKEEEHLVPPASEPVPREKSYLKPRPERAEVFQSFTFVFLTKSQYENLLPVITGGSGKALCWEWEPGGGKADDLVSYVREIAGIKSGSNLALSRLAGKGGVVVVRISESHRQEATGFMREVDLALDQRSIEQSEFLDAILQVDASGLKRALPESQGTEPQIAAAQPQTSLSHQARSDDQLPVIERTEGNDDEQGLRTEAAPKQPTPPPQVEQQPSRAPPASSVTMRGRRVITQSRFKGFDDFDASQFVRPGSDSPPPSSAPLEPSQVPSAEDIDAEGHSQAPPSRHLHGIRKRPAPTDQLATSEIEAEVYENMLSGQAALKRRRTEAARRGEKNGFAQCFTETDRAAVKAQAAEKKEREKQIDVKAELRAKREKEEERRRKDEEALEEQLEGIDINDIRSRVKIEEMAVPVREPRASRRSDGGEETPQDPRWDPAWNGRKNFKKFRPQGQGRGETGPRLQRVIVTLEEVPRRGHGLGDEYWLTSSTSAAHPSEARRGGRSAQSQSQSQTQPHQQQQHQGTHEGDTGAAERSARTLRISHEEDTERAVDTELLPYEIAGRARDPTIRETQKQTQTQTLVSTAQSHGKAAGKRPAMMQDAGPPPKKTRQSRLDARSSRARNEPDDDDGDGLRFRRTKW